MLDRVDGTRELLDRRVSSTVRSATTTGGRAERAVLGAVHVEWHDPERVAEHRGEPHRGAGLEMPVVRAVTQPVEKTGRGTFELDRHFREGVVGPGILGDRAFDRGARLAQRAGRRIDRERGLVAEEMPGHRGQHEREHRVHRRHRDRLERGAEAVVALRRDHERRSLVRPEDRDLFGDVVGVGAAEPGRADEDEWLGRQVDVLLVFGDVARDRLVAELGQFDAKLVRRDAIAAVADDGPVAP